MEQTVKGKSDLVSFSREVDKLVDSYTVGDSVYRDLFSDITNTAATKALLSKAGEIVTQNQDLKVPVGAAGAKKTIKDCRVEDFPDLFGAKMFFSGALTSSCTASFREGSPEIEACRAAQLKLRIIAPLSKTVGSDEEARASMRQIFYIIYESNIYKDAHVSKEFDAFAAAVKSLVAERVRNGWTARAAMSD